MMVATRLAAFAAMLALAFAGAALAGAAIDPTSEAETARGPHAMDAHGGESGAGHAMSAMGRAGSRADEPAGLSVSQGGYTLAAARTAFAAQRPSRLAFRITDRHGRAVRDGYELESERELHLIVVRRDGRHYQHLHPTRDASGTWSAPLTLPAPGVYRAYADFQIAGRRHTLGTDLFVPGDFRSRPLPAPRPTAATDRYAVVVDTGSLRGGVESELAFRVTRGGEPVEDLQPYLGARGHLVALREGDLAYLHVHPDTGRSAANEIRFASIFPTGGRYRLFLQFKTGGRVRTVAYTLEVPR